MEEEAATTRCRLLVPFEWEETPGTPKRCHRRRGSRGRTTDIDKQQQEEGEHKLKPLKLPPRLEVVSVSLGCSGSRRSLSARWARSTTLLLRPPRQLRSSSDLDFDPFQKAIQETISRFNDEYDAKGPTSFMVDNGRIKRTLRDFLLSKTPPEHNPDSVVGNHPAVPCPPSFTSRRQHPEVSRELKFSSFRSLYDDDGRSSMRKHGPGSVVLRSFRKVLPEELGRKPSPPRRRRSLLRHLALRPSIHRVLKKVFGA